MFDSTRSRRDFLRDLGRTALAAPLLGTGACALTGDRPPRRPNVVVLLTDDQRHDTLAALGNSDIHTPHMDRLVRRGTAFTRAHIMGGSCPAVCMPSRAMLLTGRTLFHLDRKGRRIPAEHVMLPELFRRHDYATFGTGKWHNGRPAFARCFTDGGSIFFGGMSNHRRVPVYDFDPQGRYPRAGRRIAKGFSSELFADQAVRFLRQRQDTSFEDNPFFLYVSFTAPHDPRTAPKAYADKYIPERLPTPPNFASRHPFDNGELTIRDEKLAPWPRTPAVVKRHLAAYYAMITHLDAQIGRILDALDATGQADNTIVVLAGDNGLAVGQHGLLGKQNLYDHSVRIPLVLAGPGLAKGARRDRLGYLHDLLPTLCRLADLPVPASNQGRDLLAHPARSSLFLAYRNFQRAVTTTDGWKLIEYDVKGKRRTQLFHLAGDPWERRDLAGEPAHAARKERMKRLLQAHKHRLDDPLTRPGPIRKKIG